jgi:hypothetical protein
MSRDQFLHKTLEIVGDQGDLIPNQLFQQQSPNKMLAILYPGMRYTCDKPLLYYTTELLLARGYDVLQLWSDYQDDSFEQLSQAEKSIRLISDGQALFNAGQQAGNFEETILCGKSLGTLIMAFILSQNQDLPNLKTIWLTPLLNFPPVSEIILNNQAPIFIAGSLADLTFNSGPYDQFESKTNITSYFIEEADHSLEVPGNTIQSINILDQLIRKISDFVD